MMTRIKDITDFLDSICPPETAESWDNPGLMTGKRDEKVTSVVLSLDTTSAAITRCESSSVASPSDLRRDRYREHGGYERRAAVADDQE